MTVSRIATATSGSTPITTNASFSLAGGAGIRGVLILVAAEGGPDEVGAVTYGGTTVPEMAGSPLRHLSGEFGNVHAFFLGSSVPTGTQTVAVATLGASQRVVVAVALGGSANLEAVDIDTSINSDSIVNPAVTLQLGGRTSYCAIVFVSGQNAATGITPAGGLASLVEGDFGTNVCGCYDFGTTMQSSNPTLTVTQTAEDFTAIAVAISEVVLTQTVNAGVLVLPLLPVAASAYAAPQGVAFIFTPAKVALARGEYDFVTNDLRLILVGTQSACEGNPDAQYVADISPLDEYDGAGYTRKSLLQSLGTYSPDVWVDPPDAVYADLGPGTRPIANVVLYRHVGADSANPLIACLGRGGAAPMQGDPPQDFTLHWADSRGLLRIA